MSAKNNKGFTLVEIIVGLALSIVVLGSIYTIYVSQQKAYIVQEEVAKMQQNLRAALLMMASDLRMAGYDPSGKSGAGIVSIATAPHSIRFTKDISGNGTIGEKGEDITFSLVPVGGVNKLVRDDANVAGTSEQEAVAENLEVLDLVYLDENNTAIANPAANINDIRSIEITLVARSNRSEEKYTNNFIYRNQQDQNVFGPAGDNVRRSKLTMAVRCRNLGL